MSADTFFTLHPEGARLTLRVTPNARADRIEGIETRADGTVALRVRVSAPPDKGSANAAVVALLAKSLRLPKSAFTLLQGETARIKVVAITATGDLDAALQDLAGPK